VATMKELKGKPNIEYPCNWSYKVIGEEIIELEIAIKEITNMRDPKIKQTNKSKTGKYITYDIQILVHSEVDRYAIFDLFKQHHTIKMVL